MTQSIVIQVGQCGNQLGMQFWDLALREHLQHLSTNKQEYSEECFFRSVKKSKQQSELKARAVLVDMEEGVINQALTGPLSTIFDSKQKITDVSGSGNNWAVGNKFYGKKYGAHICNLIRKEAEKCDYLQSFFIMHSTGGGTGSGLGSAITELLYDEFCDVERLTLAVLPSINDDVITSPYNTVLTLKRLSEFSDCVIPVDNQALLDICLQVEKALPVANGKITIKQESPITSSFGSLQKKIKPYDQMNNIVANLFLNLTSHSRFHGSLNVDLSEITMNLVPFPKLHYLVPSLTPLYALSDIHIPPRRLDQMFSEAFSTNHHLLQMHSNSGVHLACALLARGKVQISDIQRNIKRLQHNVKFAKWNEEGWKIGLCPVPPVGHPFSLLALKNTTAITHNFETIRSKFVKLYKRKAHIHHFLDIDEMEVIDFEEAQTSLTNLICEYNSINKNSHISARPRLSV